MKTMYSVLAVVVLLSISCSKAKTEKTVEEEEKPKQDNHVHFLSIGNSHYQKDESGQIANFMDVSGAGTSAKYVAGELSRYGSGLSLESSKDKLITKELINQYVDSIVKIAVKDSLSTTFIYYCGHGFSDKAGNIFLVPGNHHFNEGDSKSMESLISVNDIQQRIIDAITKIYPPTPADKQVLSEFGDLTERPGRDPESMAEVEKGGNNKIQKLYDLGKKLAGKYKRPKFVILADCCTENLSVVNYSMLVNRKYTKDFDELLQNMKKMGIGENSYQYKEMEKSFSNLGYTLSVGMLKGMIWMGGHRTIYTGDIGKPAVMVPSPADKSKLVGPICRRMALFFDNGKKSFTVADMLSSLCDAKFDAVSQPAKYEKANSNWFGGGDVTMGYHYIPKLGSSLDFDVRDSLVFVK